MGLSEQNYESLSFTEGREFLEQLGGLLTYQ
jgi:hypothetical protein